MRAEVSLQQYRSLEDSPPALRTAPLHPLGRPGSPPFLVCVLAVSLPRCMLPSCLNASSSVTTARLLPQASTSRSRPPTPQPDAHRCSVRPLRLPPPRRPVLTDRGTLARLVGPKKETDLGRWAAPSAVACAARRAQGPLPAGGWPPGAHSPPRTSSGIATAAGAVTPPPSRVTWSLHSGDKWPSAQPLSISRAQSLPGWLSISCRSLSKKTWTPRWTAFLWEQLGALQEGGPGQALDYPVLTDGRRALMSQA